MIGVNIIAKSGLLLFSHFFVPGFSDVDEDLRAGLMTAVLSVIQDTQQTGIKTIDQGNYFVHIIEGKYTYGLFFSHENDLKEQKFANTSFQNFESVFQEKLKEDNSLDDDEFLEFREYLNRKYSSLIAIDVVGLSKIIEIMQESFFSDYIILEKPNLHQVFTNISSLSEIHPYANQIATMCKNIIESSMVIGHEITHLQFDLGETFFVSMNRFAKYLVIIIVDKKDRDKAVQEIIRIRNRMEFHFY